MTENSRDFSPHPLPLTFHGLILPPERQSREGEHDNRYGDDDEDVEGEGKFRAEGRCRVSQEHVLEGVDAVGERIDVCELPQRRGHGRDRIHGAGEKEHGHHEKVHNDVEAVEGREPSGDKDADGRDAEGDEKSHARDLNDLDRGDPDAEERDEHQDDQRLGNGDQRAGDGLADHDGEARDRRHKHLLHEPELPVPDNRDGREYRREQDRHADHAGKDELQVGNAGMGLDERGHAVPDNEKPEHRPGQGAEKPALFAEELLELPQADDVYGPELDHRCALAWLRTNSRMTSLPFWSVSSLMVLPVSLRKTSFSVGFWRLTDRVSTGSACINFGMNSSPRSVSSERPPFSSRAVMLNVFCISCTALRSSAVTRRMMSPCTMALSLAGEPSVMILPWSMMAMRSQFSASSI